MRRTTAFLSILLLAVACSGEPPGKVPPPPPPAACGPASDPAKDGPFPPAGQAPLLENGLILPPNSLPCTPLGSMTPQSQCNHHASTVAELPDGSLAAVWYHGVAEKSPDSRLVWSRKQPGQTSWTAPEVLFDEPDHAEGNPAIWVHPDGTLHVFFVTIFGTGWDQSKVRMIRSTDGGATWSAPTLLRDQYCWNARHRPLRFDDGELLLPLYVECLALPQFMRSGDDFKTWSEDPQLPFLEHVTQIQPALIGRKDGAVLAITRDGAAPNRIHRMLSEDRGKTWTRSEPIGLPNAGTSVDWVRLGNGHVVVVFNNSPDDRFPLSAALSYDDGDTFVAVRDLNATCEGQGCAYAYPSMLQSAKDGTLWVTYTHNRETIGWAHFNEAWLAAGDQRANLRCLAGELCADGACYVGCGVDADCVIDPAGEAPDAGSAGALVCRESRCRTPCKLDQECCHGRCDTGFCVSTLPAQCTP